MTLPAGIRVRLAAGCLPALLAVVLLVPATAGAHAVLENTSPERDSVVRTEPKIVSFSFGEPVSGTAGAVRVYDAKGARVDQGDAGHPGSDPKVYGVALKPGLPRGTYTATYRIVSADTHVVTGGFVFSIGRASGTGAATVGQLLAAQSTGSVTTDAFIVTRAVQYAAIAIAVGVLAFLLLAWLPALSRLEDTPARTAASERALRRVRLLVMTAAAAGLLSALVGIGLEGAEAAGVSLWNAIDATIVGDVLGTRFGAVWLAAAVIWPCAIAGASVLLRSHEGIISRSRIVALATPLAALIALPAVAGHSSVSHPVWLLVPMNLIHVSAMALWLGGLTALVFAAPVATRELAAPDRTRLLAATLGRFSPIALACVIALLATGIVQALVEIDAWSELLHTAYGRAVLIKVGLLAVLIGLGAQNRQRTVPRMRRLAAAGESPGAAGVALRRALRAEVAIVAIVLVVAGALAGYAPAKAVESGPAQISSTIGPAQLTLDVSPARVGANEIHIYLLDPKSGAQYDATKQLTVTATLPSKGIGPLALQPQDTGPGHYTIAGAVLGAPGTWTLDLTARVSDFVQYDRKVKVRIR